MRVLHHRHIAQEETPQRLPGWVLPGRNQPAHFADLMAACRKENWFPEELLLLEHLVKYTQRFTKSDCLVSVTHFLSCFKASTETKRREEAVQTFFNKLIYLGYAEIAAADAETQTITQVRLLEPVSLAEQQTKVGLLALRNYLTASYARKNFDELINPKAKHTLPCLETLQAAAIDLDRDIVITKTALYDAAQIVEQQNILPSDETLEKNGKAFVGYRFPAQSAGAAEYTLLFNSAENLPEIINHFMLPLLKAFLDQPDVKPTYEILRNTAAKEHATDKSKPAEYPSIDRLIKNLFLGPDLNENYYFVLTTILGKILEIMHNKQVDHSRSLAFVETPIILQTISFINAYAIANRQNALDIKKRAAEFLADRDIVVSFLLKDCYEYCYEISNRGPVPQSLEAIGKLKDSTGKKTLAEKYPDVLTLLIKDGKLLPWVVEIHGTYIHRWQFINYFLLMVQKEKNLVTNKLAHLWATDGIPFDDEVLITARDLSPEFVAVATRMGEYRTGFGLNITETQGLTGAFIATFFPTAKEALTNKVEKLVKTVDDNGDDKFLRKYTTTEIDKVLFRKNSAGKYELRPVHELFTVEFKTAEAGALREMELLIDNVFKLYWYRFLYFIGSPYANGFLKKATRRQQEKQDILGALGHSLRGKISGVQNTPVKQSAAKAKQPAAKAKQPPAKGAPAKKPAAPLPRTNTPQRTAEQQLSITARSLNLPPEKITKLIKDSNILNYAVLTATDETDGLKETRGFIKANPTLDREFYAKDPTFIRYVYLLLLKKK